MNRNGIVHLDCCSGNTFSGLGLLSTLIFILRAFVLWGFCPMWLFSVPHVITWTEWGLSTPVSRDHMNRNGVVHLDCWSVNIFCGLGLLSALIFYPWGFCLMGLLSIGLFSVPPTWSHEQNGDCPHLYHVITLTEMGLYILIVGVLTYFLVWGFCPLWFFFLGLLCPPPRDHTNRMGIAHTCITWSLWQKWDYTSWLLEC